ncbi:nucleotidyltransferase family protein [Marivita sp. GX14005]|uniref:nucleotidyltransferase family protein n=1 Tax=Marivita sp. GX14005 TaxID=2942276 RepID=UPI0020193AB6|nr:nucleotidyltransferase family protein [Marivita sp. GX14005]MCL3881596.1 nucleotidyltransferase family protein [Marivita sp. GX14005]
MPDTVMLFAAGFGTRMGALTEDRPKPLIEVAGTPLIDHALRLARAITPRKIVTNAHYRAEQIIDHLSGQQVEVLVESPKILDTGGGLKAALPLLDAEAVFTMNTDAIWKGPNPFALLHDAWQDDMKALLLCVPCERAAGHDARGDLDILPDGRAVWGTKTVFTGLQIIRTDIVANHPASVFSLKAIWDDLEADGTLRAIAYPGQWCDVGHPEGIALAEALLDDPDV